MSNTGCVSLLCLIVVWFVAVSGEVCPYEGNHITTVPAKRLLPNLTEISLINNPITTIDDTAFEESATTLEILTFSKALFTQIPDAFLHLKALRYLSIAYTKIQDWNVEALKNIGRYANSLFLENVGLTECPSWIQYFSNLTELVISDSSISSLSDDALDIIANTLTKLSIINNNLTSIPKSFAKLHVLQWLTVQGTDVADITWLPQSNSLLSLRLANNNISDSNHQSSSLHQLAGSLKYVDLQSNTLTHIPNISFMINLEYVNLNHNQIAESNFGSLPASLGYLDLAVNSLPLVPPFLSRLEHVSYLNLLRNYIKEIRGIDFPSSTKIADFGYNLITELTDTSFPQNSSIWILSLNNNPIVKMSILAFENLPNLDSLSLQYINLTRLPLALASLTGLGRFDISDSSDLVCTCTEKSLESVVLSIVDVIGNCGETNIQYFFANLSSDCPVP